MYIFRGVFGFNNEVECNGSATSLISVCSCVWLERKQNALIPPDRNIPPTCGTHSFLLPSLVKPTAHPNKQPPSGEKRLIPHAQLLVGLPLAAGEASRFASCLSIALLPAGSFARAPKPTSTLPPGRDGRCLHCCAAKLSSACVRPALRTLCAQQLLLHDLVFAQLYHRLRRRPLTVTATPARQPLLSPLSALRSTPTATAVNL